MKRIYYLPLNHNALTLALLHDYATHPDDQNDVTFLELPSADWTQHVVLSDQFIHTLHRHHITTAWCIHIVVTVTYDDIIDHSLQQLVQQCNMAVNFMALKMILVCCI